MFCTNCGTQGSGSSFCPSCGASLTASPTNNQVSAPSAVFSNTTIPTDGAVWSGNSMGGAQLPPAPMGFDLAIKKFFKDYATFGGRSRRSEYWYQYLFVSLVSFFTLLLTGVDGGFTNIVASLALLVPTLAAVSRRLHDVGKSFGYFFFALIPLVGIILLIVWLATDGDRRPNVYGQPVK